MRDQTKRRDWGIAIDLVLLLGILLIAVGLYLFDFRLAIVWAGMLLVMLTALLARR